MAGSEASRLEASYKAAHCSCCSCPRHLGRTSIEEAPDKQLEREDLEAWTRMRGLVARGTPDIRSDRKDWETITVTDCVGACLRSRSGRGHYHPESAQTHMRVAEFLAARVGQGPSGTRLTGARRTR